MIIQTKRLSLRPLRMEDAPRLRMLAGDYRVARMTGTIPYPYSEEQAGRWIGDVLAGEEGVVFAIEEQGRLIGCAGYRPHDVHHGEIGYWIGKPFWGLGYATEAVGALIAHGFEQDGFDYFLGGHYDDNPASGRVLEKLGFVRNGEEVRYCEARGLEQRTLLYRLTRESVFKQAV
ncbi:GNAT family N-acetyltransferase [Methyloligella sp. 2.7D]|uniref:GNAT family N-acetyltransferase n=1 Tax=unclassified Methyloligella TaxID=2625955 RepID=UPI00157C036B|nr:GNAT family N-acetyltransferase [Methyloligella sp. GL2]QKP76360.1 GNAT family N-acetyltransferase [Methyloligella sp. GL2]